MFESQQHLNKKEIEVNSEEKKKQNDKPEEETERVNPLAKKFEKKGDILKELKELDLSTN